MNGKDPRKAWAVFFDGHAPIYESNVFTTNTLAEVDFLQEALELDAGASILDIGCGTGRHSIELATRGYRVTGVDLSAGMLEQARTGAAKAGVVVEWIQCDATRFAPKSLYDAVICLCEGAFGLLGSGDDAIRQPQAILRNVAAALKPGSRCLFTVLNGYALARRHGWESVEKGIFSPLELAEISECSQAEADESKVLRERGFVPTELVLLFETAGLSVLGIWGGTAGNWGRRPIDPDEIEIMVLGRKD